MTGLKGGSGSDPFAEEVDEEGQEDGGERGDPAESSDIQDGDLEDPQQFKRPWRDRRDGVEDGRKRQTFFVQKNTLDRISELQRDLEDALDDDIPVMDVREAVLLAGLDEDVQVVDVLRSWGFGI